MKYSLLIITILLSSCNRWMFPTETTADPLKVFDFTQKKVKSNYSFFELKKINWDSISISYRKKIKPTTTNDELFEILNSYLGELKDGHVNIFTKNNKGRYWNWYNDYPDNFNKNFVEAQYLKKNFEITGPFYHNWIDSIGYIYYGSFSSNFSTEETNYIFKKYKSAKGLIIDVRDNGGGSTNNLLNLVGRFVKNKTWIGCTSEKTGFATNDFSNSKDIFVYPQGNYQFNETPIIVLTNRRCYSATSFFAAFMSTLPNVTIVGDKTGGGSGIPISSELPNGWSVRYSASKTINTEGLDFELGVNPDYFIQTGPNEELEKKDALIEKGKELILSKSKK
ncbi:MAG: S41 family peptidase [Saprospiraceae bacterium]|nr:S41 family peptidase [Saprospiraceae bacterium]